MKEIKFRPLRIVGGKVIVTSYMGWRKLFTANYEGAKIKMLPIPKLTGEEDVYRLSLDNEWWTVSKYEQLFWPTEEYFEAAKIKTPSKASYNRLGFHSMVHDCCGCPTFSHWTSYYLATISPTSIWDFEPLKVKTVLQQYEQVFNWLEKLGWESPPTSESIL